MIALVVAVTAAISGGAAEFKTAYPNASVVPTPDGARLTHASGFEATRMGDTAESAAAAFLHQYRAAFGIGPRQRLVTRDHGVRGQAVAVHFDRLVRGLPVFEGGIVVGVNANNAVILVNSSDVPERLTGQARISRNAAIRAAKAAIPGLNTSDVARADLGWRSTGHAVRPVWRVQFTAIRPSGDWRSYVDAETGKVLLRVDLRSSASVGNRR